MQDCLGHTFIYFLDTVAITLLFQVISVYIPQAQLVIQHLFEEQPSHSSFFGGVHLNKQTHKIESCLHLPSPEIKCWQNSLLIIDDFLMTL